MAHIFWPTACSTTKLAHVPKVSAFWKVLIQQGTHPHQLLLFLHQELFSQDKKTLHARKTQLTNSALVFLVYPLIIRSLEFHQNFVMVSSPVKGLSRDIIGLPLPEFLPV